MKGPFEGLATLGPIGYLPKAPATWASAATAIAGWYLPALPLLVTIGLLIPGTALSVWICGRAEKTLGHDAKPIVLDEVVGQSIALLGAPHSWTGYFAAFALFRLFDIWKPLGAREAQALPGGQGVVADDVIAGLTACAVLHLGLWGARSAGIQI